MSLNWETKRILVSMRSVEEQSILIEAPSDIEDIIVNKGDVDVWESDLEHRRNLSLPAGEEVILTVSLK